MEDLRPSTDRGVGRSQEAWAHALEANNIEEFYERVQSGSPKEWVLWNDRIKSFASSYFAKEEEFVPEFTQADFTIPEELNDWWFENIQVCFILGRSAPSNGGPLAGAGSSRTCPPNPPHSGGSPYTMVIS